VVRMIFLIVVSSYHEPVARGGSRQLLRGFRMGRADR
jgi:hypothetical protein